MVQPTSNWILIKNFTTSILKKEELDMIPPSQQAEYLKKLEKKIAENVEVLAVGPDCRQVEAGDMILLEPERYIILPDEEHMVIRETAVFAILK